MTQQPSFFEYTYSCKSDVKKGDGADSSSYRTEIKLDMFLDKADVVESNFAKQWKNMKSVLQDSKAAQLCQSGTAQSCQPGGSETDQSYQPGGSETGGSETDQYPPN
jgi:hypothetical protein